MPDTDKANVQHRSVLETARTSYKKVSTKTQKYVKIYRRRKRAETRQNNGEKTQNTNDLKMTESDEMRLETIFT